MRRNIESILLSRQRRQIGVSIDDLEGVGLVIEVVNVIAGPVQDGLTKILCEMVSLVEGCPPIDGHLRLQRSNGFVHEHDFRVLIIGDLLVVLGVVDGLDDFVEFCKDLLELLAWFDLGEVEDGVDDFEG